MTMLKDRKNLLFQKCCFLERMNLYSAKSVYGKGSKSLKKILLKKEEKRRVYFSIRLKKKRKQNRRYMKKYFLVQEDKERWDLSPKSNLT